MVVTIGGSVRPTQISSMLSQLHDQTDLKIYCGASASDESLVYFKTSFQLLCFWSKPARTWLLSESFNYSNDDEPSLLLPDFTSDTVLAFFDLLKIGISQSTFSVRNCEKVLELCDIFEIGGVVGLMPKSRKTLTKESDPSPSKPVLFGDPRKSIQSQGTPLYSLRSGDKKRKSTTNEQATSPVTPRKSARRDGEMANKRAAVRNIIEEYAKKTKTVKLVANEDNSEADKDPSSDADDDQSSVESSSDEDLVELPSKDKLESLSKEKLESSSKDESTANS